MNLGPSLVVDGARLGVVMQQDFHAHGVGTATAGEVERRDAIRVLVVGRRAQIQQSLESNEKKDDEAVL